ncbi:MAG: hypothetical protein AAF657_31770 [Acidobacteriota bacterium]
MNILGRLVIVVIFAVLIAPQPASAVITFDQLDDDIFIISHRVKIIGSRGKAQRMVYEKAASLCVATGFSYFKILNQESNASQQYESANASVRVQFYHRDADERIGCEKNASREYIDQAKAKLAKKGYQPPEKPDPAAAAEGESGTSTCTVDQITAMVRANFSDEQIKAACPDD